MPFWSDGTAFTMPKRYLQMSILRPWRYGITPKADIAVHPVGFVQLPHLFLKKYWFKFKMFQKSFYFSSRHGVYLPKWGLELLRKLNIKSLQVPTEAPFSIAFQNEILISHFLRPLTSCSSGDYLLTFRLGIKYAYNFNTDLQPVINYPILFRETMVFTPKPVWYVGFDLDAHLNSTFNYFADIDFYSVNFKPEYISVESKAGIMGYFWHNWSAFAGIKLAYSTLPGRNRFSIIPLAGISYIYKHKSKKGAGMGLFKPELFKYKDTSAKFDIDEYYDKLHETKNSKDSIP